MAGMVYSSIFMIFRIIHSEISNMMADPLTSNEPPHGLLGSRENGGQNTQGAGSREEKSLGSREQMK